MATTVIPFYGVDLRYLRETIASALEVTPHVVVVDDASPVPVKLDNAEVIRREVNGGPGPAMNTGIASLPPNALVCRLDCRDRFWPDAKQRQLALGVASFSWTWDPIAEQERRPSSRWWARMRTDNQFSSSGIVFPVLAWRAAGGYSECLRWAGDWDFALRVQQAVGWIEHQEITATHGEHPGGHTDVRGNDIQRRERDVQRVRDFARSLR